MTGLGHSIFNEGVSEGKARGIFIGRNEGISIGRNALLNEMLASGVITAAQAAEYQKQKEN